MRIVIGQGSCGIASGAKKTAIEFDKILGENSLPYTPVPAGCIGLCYLEPIVDIVDESGNVFRYVKSLLFRAFYTTIELPDDLFSKRKACLRDSHLCGRLFFPKNSRKKTQKAENHLY